jgi:Zn-dependent alcohol dehydrogenase
MKAAVCYELGKPLVVEDVRLDPPGVGEVRVRIGAVAICHSDVHLIRGDWLGWSSTPPPVVAGHEAAGIVDDLGPGVTGVRPGDPVVVSLLRTCGRCVP